MTPADGGAAGVSLYREIDALGGTASTDHERGYVAAIDDVLAILTRRGFSEHVEAVPADRVAFAKAIASKTYAFASPGSVEEGSDQYDCGEWEEMGCDAQATYLAAADAVIARNGQSGTDHKLLTIAREFIDKHHVSCPEATTNDGVYEEAPLLVEALAEVVGYYSYPEDDA